MTIGERLLKYRKANNLSQEEVAEKLEVTRQTISKWETDMSTPDFDKIVPLCELFNITADELLTGTKKEIEKENIKDIPKKSNNIMKALVISVSVFLYFVAVSWIIIAEEVIRINDGLMVSIFMILCAIPTCILIYYFVSRNKEEIEKLREEKKSAKENESIKKSIATILSLLTTCLYIWISFMTMAWHITWIIWLIYAALISLIDLLFDLGGKKDE